MDSLRGAQAPLQQQTLAGEWQIFQSHRDSRCSGTPRSLLDQTVCILECLQTPLSRRLYTFVLSSTNLKPSFGNFRAEIGQGCADFLRREERLSGFIGELRAILFTH